MKNKVKQIAPIVAEILIKAAKAFSEKYADQTVPVYVVTDDIVVPGPTTNLLSEVLDTIYKESMGVGYDLYITPTMSTSRTPYLCIKFNKDVGHSGCFHISVLTEEEDDMQCHYSEMVENYCSSVQTEQFDVSLLEKIKKVSGLITALGKKLTVSGTMEFDGQHFTVPFCGYDSARTDGWSQEQFDSFKQLRDLLGELCVESFKIGTSFRVNLSLSSIVNGTRVNYAISETNGIMFTGKKQEGWRPTMFQGVPMMERVMPFGGLRELRPVQQGWPGMGNPGFFGSYPNGQHAGNPSAQQGYPGMHPMYPGSMMSRAETQPRYQPNSNVKPPEYQTVSEGRNPYSDSPKKD